MKEPSPADIGAVLAHVAITIGPPDGWKAWPGGWREDIEAALVDSVFSARAVYKTKSGRGIHARVNGWMGARERTTFSLEALLAEFDALGIAGWMRQFGNSQVSPGRPADAPGGPSKAATVKQAAEVLTALGVSVASQITPSNIDRVRQQLRSVPGVGFATVNYFLMLLGLPGVKPDRMIHRFLEDATGHSNTNAYAEALIAVVARELAVQDYELDHAAWSYESRRAGGR